MNARNLPQKENDSSVTPLMRPLLTPTSVGSKVLHAVPFIVLFFGSAIMMLQKLNRGLWADEAWVANSIIADHLQNMFFYDSWLQTTPPLFLILARICVSLFGLSDLSLRCLPVIFALIAIPVFASLVRRIFGTRFAFLATILVAFSPLAIRNSQEVKQFSGELMVACILLLLSWQYLQTPEIIQYYKLLVGSCLFAALSYTTVMILPVCLCCMVLAETEVHRKILRVSGYILSTAVSLGCLYYVFVRPNTDSSLYLFWSGYFPHGHTGNYLYFYVNQFLELISLLLIPWRSAGTLRMMVSLVLAIVAVSGIVGVFGKRKSANRVYQFYLLTFLPLITLIALNLLRIYPMGVDRTELFLLPCLAIWLIFSAKNLWESFGRLSVQRIPLKRWVAMSTLFAVLISGASIFKMRQRKMENWEDVEGALWFLRQSLLSTDLVYVHASVLEQTKLYMSMWKWTPTRLLLGNTGGACCPRIESAPHPKVDTDYLMSFIGRNLPPNRRSRIWVLCTGRSIHWGYLGRNDAQSIELRFGETGCEKNDFPGFHEVVLQRYECD